MKPVPDSQDRFWPPGSGSAIPFKCLLHHAKGFIYIIYIILLLLVLMSGFVVFVTYLQLRGYVWNGTIFLPIFHLGIGFPIKLMLSLTNCITASGS